MGVIKLIRLAKDRDAFEKVKMFGGKGTVNVSPLFSNEEYKGKARLIGILTIQPGCSVGNHKHNGDEEIIYILKGEATYYDEGKKYTLYPGDSALTLDGMGHKIENNSEDILEYIAIVLTN